MPRVRWPACSTCGSYPALVRVSPIEAVHELRIYQCRKCGQVDCFEVTAGPEPTWTMVEGERLERIVNALKDGAP